MSMLRAAVFIAAMSGILTTQLPSAQAACSSECQRRCSVSVARGDPGPQYKTQSACERYWGKLNENPQRARSEMDQVNQAAATRGRSCKAALNICLTRYVRPGTDDAAKCRAAYNQARKTGFWPAHAETNSPSFPCTK
jgi:hypothetical protein